MARVTVGPKSGGGWQVTGDNSAFKTQRDAVGAARRQLQGSGGGELVTKNRDGKVREQNTIGRPDPRKSKG
jgi:Uncharacterized protein conserved in bacteria (DUF2188)